MVDRLYIGNWVFNTRRNTSQFMPGAADTNIDLAGWITEAIAQGLISLGNVGGGGSPDGNGIYDGSGVITSDTQALVGEYAFAIGNIADFPEFSITSGLGNAGPPNIGLYIDNRYEGGTYAQITAGSTFVSCDERYGFALRRYKLGSSNYETTEYMSSLATDFGALHGIQFIGNTVTDDTTKLGGSYFSNFCSTNIVSSKLQHGILFGSGPSSSSTISDTHKISTWFCMGNIENGEQPGGLQVLSTTTTVQDGFAIGANSPTSGNRSLIKGKYTSNKSTDSLTIFDYYNLPNAQPSVTSGEISIMMWTGNGTTTTPSMYNIADSYVDSAAAITGGVAIGEIWYNTTTNKFNVRLS